MLHTCLIIDLRFGRYIVDVAATAHHKAVLAVIQPFHTFYASCPVEIRETADADPPSLFDCHSSYTHSPMSWKFEIQFFSLLWSLLGLHGRESLFLWVTVTADKGRIRQVWGERARTEYPSFQGTRKFADGCRQALPTKARAALGIPSVRSIFARKKLPGIRPEGCL